MQNNLFGKKLTYASLACDENYKDVKGTGGFRTNMLRPQKHSCEA